jgi:hypothetical protein
MFFGISIVPPPICKLLTRQATQPCSQLLLPIPARQRPFRGEIQPYPNSNDVNGAPGMEKRTWMSLDGIVLSDALIINTVSVVSLFFHVSR